ncbi:hypothetical protein ARMGADRAFT_1070546 [Armillaria gallica]|uniref:Ribonuclease H1 N-terminal domain-containing protein n=1 Tax=Armillaria gallica TaxID=47427 RepID=A0A2H3E9H5_ARMGA|nr:hypothetical protein ARMGADRAFT_1070546 [Armillaria gallica]
MTQFTPEQLASLLAVLGLSPPDTQTTTCDTPGTSPDGNSATSVGKDTLHSFYCFNCGFPNVVSVNAICASNTNVEPSRRALVQADCHPVTSTPSSASTTPTPATQPTTAPAPPSSPTVPDANDNSPAPTAPAAVAAPAPTSPTVVTALQATVMQGPSVPGSSVVSPSDGPWYTVSKGLAIGVFCGWQTVSPLVTGVGRACYFRHSSQAAAQEAFNQALAAGAVEVLH